MAIEITDRDRAKAERRTALLREAARLFAANGFAGVSLEDLGAAVGVSGPAVYRHFSGKQALLGALLIDVSERLQTGGSAVVSRYAEPAAQLEALVEFHVTFALTERDVIRVQDRDLAQLRDEDRAEVRRRQRAYIDDWVEVVSRLLPEISVDAARLRVQAAFGLMNSTPHSTSSRTATGEMSATLRAMTHAALLAPTRGAHAGASRS